MDSRGVDALGLFVKSQRLGRIQSGLTGLEVCRSRTTLERPSELGVFGSDRSRRFLPSSTGAPQLHI